jgi:tRNA dimethylallyltransferase
MTNNLIVILGPTGVGKSGIAVELAQRLGCEIISADSRQFYKEMRIGTAVPDNQQLNAVKHHFIQFIPAHSYYSSSLFERDVLQLLPQLFSTNKTAIMAGGSGLYIDAVCNGIDDIPDIDSDVRAKYNSMYIESGIEGLRAALKLLDPEHYSKVDLKNHKRLIRALEICESTGRPYSSFLTKRKTQRDFAIIKIGLSRNRDELYDMINKRVDKMIAEGLEDEAKSLYGLKHLNALNSVGYREFFNYFDGQINMDEAISLIKRNSRRYAKRQMTWWAKDNEITWFNAESKEEIFQFVCEILSSKKF